ncbi:MAG: ABC transporter substrate-binding protein [Comamonas sp.]|nr:ABC transporter substrate-binding protein [Comamonas sp.]
MMIGKLFRHCLPYRLLGLGLVLAASLLGCGWQYEKPLVVGADLWTGYQPLYLAQDLGYYQDQPLRLVQLASSTQTLDALRMGKLDVAAITLDEALLLAQEHLPLSIIWVISISNGADAVLTRPGSAQTGQEVKGLRIGVEQTASGAYMLQAFLEQAKLPTGAVEIAPLSADEHLRAWRQHQVDILVSADPVRQTLVEEGAQVLFDSSALDGQMLNVLVAHHKALACCSAQITQLLAGHERALSYLHHQKSDAWYLMGQRSKVTPDSVQASLSAMLLPDAVANQRLLRSNDAHSLAHTLQQVFGLMQQRQLLRPGAAPQHLIDPRFTPQLAQPRR